MLEINIGRDRPFDRTYNIYIKFAGRDAEPNPFIFQLAYFVQQEHATLYHGGNAILYTVTKKAAFRAGREN